jgi:hypothetical protein
VRGHFPSWKSRKRRKYESLAEKQVQPVFDISSLVTAVETQPCVLKLEEAGATCRYTPDIRATIKDKTYFVEVKSEGFIQHKKQVARLQQVIRGMRDKNLPFFVILNSDVKENNLHDFLCRVLRTRPCPGPYRPGLDTALWDPLHRQKPSPEILSDWQEAQRQCNALLERVMRRDPDDLFAAAQR